jgi:hypothetical protein
MGKGTRPTVPDSWRRGVARLLSDGGHDPQMTAGRPIHARDDAMIGQLTGTSQRCRLEGCLGRRYGARWPDGTLTWPCSKGLFNRPDRQLQIR